MNLKDDEIVRLCAELPEELREMLWRNLYEVEQGLGHAARGLNDALAWNQRVSDQLFAAVGFGDPIDRATREIWKYSGNADEPIRQARIRTQKLMRALGKLHASSGQAAD
jgi:hypothetical protein